MNRIELNIRSACALGTISCLVLFLAASAPHRVHHLFEDLPYAGEIIQEQTHDNPGRSSQALTASNQVDTGGHEPDTNQHIASDRHHGHTHHSHHAHSSRGSNHTHVHGQADHGRSELEAVNDPGLDASGAPLHANTPHDDAHHDKSAQTVCLLQAAAQHSYLSSFELLGIPLFEIDIERRASLPAATFSLYNPSPFSQRAPPAI